MNKNATIALAVVVILVIVGAIALAMPRQDVELEFVNETAPVTPSESAEDDVVIVNTSSTATVAVPAVAPQKNFTVRGSDFKFSPASLSVDKGDRVKITFVNDGGFHDLKIDGHNVATPLISAGESAVIEFVADKAGSFEYYCTVGSHRAMGMKGTLTVK